MADWRTLFNGCVAVIFGFILRYFQERKKKKMVDLKYQVATSIIVSYITYIIYRDKKVTFCSIEIWLFFWSYFGSISVSLFDDIFKEVFTGFLRTLASKILIKVGKNPKERNHDSSTE